MLDRMESDPGASDDAPHQESPEPLGASGRGYSIRVASHLTGIPAETLRMWERRYGFPAPARAAGGVRLYTDEDIERLRLVARAQKAGYRVGEVIGQDRAQLTARLGDIRHQQAEPTGLVPTLESLVEATARDDVAGLREGLRQATLALGPRRFIAEMAGSLCVAVGEGWARGALAIRQEHVFAACFSSQLRTLRGLYDGTERPPVVLLATLPGELHSLGLEMAAVYLAASGATPRLAGADLPPEQIADAARALDADVVGISVSVAADPRVASRHLRRLTRALARRSRVWIGGAGASALDLEGEVAEIVSTFADVERLLGAVRR
jgi:DNA-binding transcriptional MerR regulator/methylmalonyl-CoA mutase cobalamin-binding subunit